MTPCELYGALWQQLVDLLPVNCAILYFVLGENM